MRINLPAGEDPVRYTMTRYFNDSTVTPREREAARARTAHQMSCAYCTAFRAARDLPNFSDEAIPEEIYEHVFEYKTWPGYTERERLAIEFAERFMIDYQDMADDEPFWERMQANFSETEIVDLCLLIGMWDSSAKMFHLLVGIEDACRIPAKSEADSEQSLQGSAT